MCGIAGLASLNGNAVEPRSLDIMLDRLVHRGPDQRGTASFDRVALGSTRLSIVDLAGGRQPIANEDGSVLVVCNGEIYNAPELRQDLTSAGHRFRTQSDTEVIVHLFEEHGVGFLDKLNGMFALALYDHTRDLLVVARDRFGVKPLYYSVKGGRLSFASEIKALRALPDSDSSLSPEGLAVFLGLFYIPDPWTAYRHLHTLRPGHALVVERGQLREHKFFDFAPADKVSMGAAEAVDRTTQLLQQAVRRQLMADVPVGVMLSGGLDSRSILYLANEVNRHTRSFTVTFDETSYDEGTAAGDWARLLGSPHQTHQFGEDEFCDFFEARQAHLDQPYGLWCNTAMSRMAAQIRAAGYKVVLGGEGGDELFLGYPTLQAAQAARFYRALPGPFRNQVVAPLVERLPAGRGPLPFSFKLKSFVRADDPDPLRNFFGFKEVVRFSTWPDLLTPEALALVGTTDPVIAFRQHLPKVSGLHWVDALSYMDLKVFLPGCGLAGIDNAFMAESVELRVPFLDNDLASFALSLEPGVRYAAFQTKPILRRALLKILSGATGDRREQQRVRHYSKAGFEIPGNDWVRRPRFGKMMAEILSAKRLERTGFFRPGAIRKIWDDQLAGRANNERVIQAAVSLQLFLERQ